MLKFTFENGTPEIRWKKYYRIKNTNTSKVKGEIKTKIRSRK